MVKYAFNGEEFVAVTPLGGEKRFPWDSLDSRVLKIKMGSAYFSFAYKGFYLPWGRSGSEQLVTLIKLKIFHLNSPLMPICDETAANNMLGKSIKGDIFHINETYQGTLVRSIVGTVAAASREIISIECASGEMLEASANMGAIQRTDTQPEYAASWYIE